MQEERPHVKLEVVEHPSAPADTSSNFTPSSSTVSSLHAALLQIFSISDATHCRISKTHQRLASGFISEDRDAV